MLGADAWVLNIPLTLHFQEQEIPRERRRDTTETAW